MSETKATCIRISQVPFRAPAAIVQHPTWKSYYQGALTRISIPGQEMDKLKGNPPHLFLDGAHGGNP